MTKILNNLNKETFIKFVSTKQNITQKEVEQAITIFTEGITQALASGHKTTLIGFGVFYTQARKARIGINPKTREKMNIPAYKQAMCRFGSDVKKAINNKKSK